MKIVAEADPEILSKRPATGPLRTMQLLRERSVEALLGRSGLNHSALSAEVRRRFGATDVAHGALVREPVIEGAAPFKVDGMTFADCAGKLLHPDVIRAISSESAGDYRFPADAQPYRHQIEAWRHLTSQDRQSVLVSSGTGSGKTECFMMPLLDDLAREAEGAGRLSGVRALALYPLNALIASQEERLRAWTSPFGGKVRFGLYNGLTPERLRARDRPGPEQVGDRETLRSDPPPILVTNVTMLEYMLVRRIDRPLVENSKGKLRWIILDEAHGYVGSAAAEIALLLRRVLLTFGVKAEDVRFVATSATIGGEGVDVTDELRHFLRDISGAEERMVHVVLGEREEVLLPPASSSSTLSAADLGMRDTLAASPAVQAFVRAAERGPVPLQRASELLGPVGQPLEEVIGAIAADSDIQRGPLLPLRIHGFLRAVPGLWSCINPHCAESPEGWPYGGIASERIEVCPCCASPVLEIMSCGECGEPYLDCEERSGRLQPRFTPPPLDEFAALREKELDEEDSAEDKAAGDGGGDLYDGERLAIAVRALTGCREAHVEPATGVRHDRPNDATIGYPVHSPDSCPACEAGATETRPQILRPFRFGAPYLIGNAAPIMLEGVEPRKLSGKAAYRPPADGRQLLSFTDSRQGSARFAANLQTTAERAFVRGFIYHATQGSMAGADGDDAKATELRAEIALLEQQPGDVLAPLIESKKAALAELETPNLKGLIWSEVRSGLAAQPEVHHWMSRVWGPRDERFRNDPVAFAEFLMLREFNRRPRRGNTLETMGLARLRLSPIDDCKSVPMILQEKGKSLADWKGLLYAIADMAIRGRAAIRASYDDMHWLHTGRPLSSLLPPGEQSEARRELAWPRVSRVGSPSNLSIILEKALQLDRLEGADRQDMNDLLAAAWDVLRAALYDPTVPGYQLDLSKARIAPVTDAWLCPVTGRVLPETALGFTIYGHRERLRTADIPPQPIELPRLPIVFPTGSSVDTVRDWLANNRQIQALREAGIWINMHDRIALYSPYTRAAEHSAQQPASRLRRFEEEFKRGEINILNCSTTMEMGVDIGSVSAVMMTNVPPSLANYRQRVGRAGRRRQGFASSLTYTRDTPLDRETFRDPVGYLARQTRAPKVRLDSRRIVQRHINALLLARWFATSGGEALKTRAGEFFGCPDVTGQSRPETTPVRTCIAWLNAPSTAQDLGGDVTRLVAGTVLAGDRTLFAAAASALESAEAAIVGEWDLLQMQIASADKEVGRASLEYQLKRLARENLLKELVVRGFLPGHGLPTAVVPFVHEDKPGADEPSESGGETSQRRRNYPSRTLDIAIRDYAPGAEVVVNGLVYRSAGVTLNWQRPADDAQAREVQSLRTFWTCPACGAADCGSSAPDRCPSCREELPFEARRRFLEPAGFIVDMGEKPHADTDDVHYVPPEPEQIVARNAAWQPLIAETAGRMRTSPDGLVFYSSKGPGQHGYHICLECGCSEPAAEVADGAKPLKDHRPLRGTRRNADGLCPGNEKSFKITQAIALGYEAVTDVVELQPVGLESEGAALAAIAALREALCRRIGIETSELGMAVRPARMPLGQRTYSLYLFDKASGGAGFASQAARYFEDILAEAEDVLDCSAPGCTNGCSACVLTADLFDRQQILDRSAALSWAKRLRADLGSVSEEDRVAEDARYTASLADAVMIAAEDGAKTITVWAGPDTDVAALGDGLFAQTARQLQARGKRFRLVVEPEWLSALDEAARLALRDACKLLSIDLRKGKPSFYPNGSRTLAQTDGNNALAWVSRDQEAANIGGEWGKAAVCISAKGPPLSAGVEVDSLLPISGTRYLSITDQLDGDLAGFGKRFGETLAPHIRAVVGADLPVSVEYNDRYLQSPLTVRLLAEAVRGLCSTLGVDGEIPLRIVTRPLKKNERQPYSPDHDWQDRRDRDEVLLATLAASGFKPELCDSGANHGRLMTLHLPSGASAHVVLDSGFGLWRAPSFARFDFGSDAATQARQLTRFNAMLTARGPSYIVITA